MDFSFSGINLNQVLIVFGATFLADGLWVLYIRRTAQCKALESSFFSMVLYLIGAVVVISYVENKIFLIPASLGAFLGSYVTIKWEAKEKDSKK